MHRRSETHNDRAEGAWLARLLSGYAAGLDDGPWLASCIAQVLVFEQGLTREELEAPYRDRHDEDDIAMLAIDLRSPSAGDQIRRHVRSAWPGWSPV